MFKRRTYASPAYAGKPSPIDAETFHIPIRGLPDAFEGYTIVQLSDTHLPDCALPPGELAALTASLRPDALFLTGDLISSYRRFEPKALQALAEALSPLAPCYAVCGNHEQRLNILPVWTDILISAGIHVPDNRWEVIERSGERLYVAGLPEQEPPAEKPAGPRLALAHRPEFFARYAQAGLDLTFSGHAHGGQMRLGRQGLYAPGQGLLPRYTSGVYQRGEARMIVSRGLGNSVTLPRVFHRPHIPVVILTRGKDEPRV